MAIPIMTSHQWKEAMTWSTCYGKWGHDWESCPEQLYFITDSSFLFLWEFSVPSSFAFTTPIFTPFGLSAACQLNLDKVLTEDEICSSWWMHGSIQKYYICSLKGCGCGLLLGCRKGLHESPFPCLLCYCILKARDVLSCSDLEAVTSNILTSNPLIKGSKFVEGHFLRIVENDQTHSMD